MTPECIRDRRPASLRARSIPPPHAVNALIGGFQAFRYISFLNRYIEYPKRPKHEVIDTVNINIWKPEAFLTSLTYSPPRYQLCASKSSCIIISPYSSYSFRTRAPIMSQTASSLACCCSDFVCDEKLMRSGITKQKNVGVLLGTYLKRRFPIRHVSLTLCTGIVQVTAHGIHGANSNLIIRE